MTTTQSVVFGDICEFARPWTSVSREPACSLQQGPVPPTSGLLDLLGFSEEATVCTSRS